jgi:hypothetical protein
MECVLCNMWARMPYAKRHTTPTNSQETEGALVVGYWMATRLPPGIVPRLCERHMHVVGMLDQQEERRAATEAKRLEQTALSAHYQGQVSDLQQRQALIAGTMPAAVPVQNIPPQNGAPPLTQQVQGPVFPVSALVPPQLPPVVQPPVHIAEVLPRVSLPEAFALGPGPLTNGNVVTAAPPLPVPEDPAAAYTGVLPSAAPQVRPTLPLGASAPIQEGAALIDAPCLFCKVMVHAGEVHICPLASGKS